MKYKEFEVVRVLKDFPEHSISKGTLGVIVHVYTVPCEAYEVEFADENGITKALFAIEPQDIENAQGE